MFGALLVLELTVKSFWCIVVATAVLALSFAARPVARGMRERKVAVAHTRPANSRTEPSDSINGPSAGTADVSTVSPAQN
ncbi:hypothetical protein AWC32_17580 [Mycobacterium xenopi]|nr:hypothetical protein AWC32_17580 [Mycobacterium xenopi]